MPYLPTVRQMFEVLGLEPSSLQGDSSEGQQHARDSFRRRARRLARKKAAAD